MFWQQKYARRNSDPFGPILMSNRPFPSPFVKFFGEHQKPEAAEPEPAKPPEPIELNLGEPVEPKNTKPGKRIIETNQKEPRLSC